MICIRILITDDSSDIPIRSTRLITTGGGMVKVIGEANPGEEATVLASECQPDTNRWPEH